MLYSSFKTNEELTKNGCIFKSETDTELVNLHLYKVNEKEKVKENKDTLENIQIKDIYFDYSQKCNNEEIFYNIDKISSAITDGVKVEFDYVSRELKGREFVDVVKRRKVSPYALTWQDDHYYLICNYEKYDNLMHLRLDRMSKSEKTTEKARHFREVSEYKETFDVADYTNKIFGMFSGDIQTVELCCKKEIAKTVIDRFSENIFITNVTENEFHFSYKAAISEALVTFIMNFGDSIKVVSPESLKRDIVERAEKILKVYKN